MAAEEPLQYLSPEQWSELKETFKNNWPKNIPGYYVLETQQLWIKLGLDYGFKVYCPFGQVQNGMVAINKKDDFYEVVIQCGNDDTSELEKALTNTKIIDRNQSMVVPYAPRHIVECIQRVYSKDDEDIVYIKPSRSFIFHKNRTLFTDTTLPVNVHLEILQQRDSELVNSTWPHRYPKSIHYFSRLIQAGCGYGLFVNSHLISWVFINDGGTLGHMFTLKNFRRKGYAAMLLKNVCNLLLTEEKDVFAHCVKGNLAASNFYLKLGFEEFSGVSWCYIKPKII